MKLRLYYGPRSCALASHIVLEHVGADYEAVKLDLAAKQQQSPEYLAINPKGRVPALVTDRGVITETPAILLYLAQTFPDYYLAPLDDAFALAQLQSVTNWFCSTVHINQAHFSRGYRWADDAAAQAAMKAKATTGEPGHRRLQDAPSTAPRAAPRASDGVSVPPAAPE